MKSLNAHARRPPDHPECPERISLLHDTLVAAGLAARCVALPSRQARARRARAASRAPACARRAAAANRAPPPPPQAADAELARAHAPEYICRVDALFSPGVTQKANDAGALAEVEGDALIISGDVSAAPRRPRAPAAAASRCARGRPRVACAPPGVRDGRGVSRPPAHPPPAPAPLPPPAPPDLLQRAHLARGAHRRGLRTAGGRAPPPAQRAGQQRAAVRPAARRSPIPPVLNTHTHTHSHTLMHTPRAQAVESVMDGAVARAFAAVRPPGHHAESAAFMGFW